MSKILTQEGFDNLKKELEELKGQRKDIALRLKKAVSYGDLSENADYQQAKEDQSFLEGKIVEIEEILKNAEIVKATGGKGMVQIGSTVTVEGNRRTDAYKIVGAEESNPVEGKISIESPMAKELMGKIVGAEFELLTPSGKKVSYKITKIE